MSIIKIEHRYTGAVLWTGEANSLGDAVKKALSEGANLRGAYLIGANLRGAYLVDANLVDANLRGAYLRGADLRGAKNYDPSTSTHAERAARYRARHPEVPVVEQLDSKILAVVETGRGTLNMKMWHKCETTHCRAGWAIHLAGARGYALEKEHGAQVAGEMIYRASTGRAPYFFSTTQYALEDIRRCAEAESKAGK